MLNYVTSIRQAAGQTTKSSITHTWVRDNRDDRITATRGEFLKFSHELAGLGGDASFYKAEAETQFSRPLLPGIVRHCIYWSFAQLTRSSVKSVSFAARAGGLFGLFGKPTLFSDRFQLGGPASIRMFRQNSMGPRDGRASAYLYSLERLLTPHQSTRWVETFIGQPE
jgi:outer membrane protein insertion porin family